MLDINFIRENIDLVKDAARKKHIDIHLDTLVKVDDQRRELLQRVEEKRAEQNVATNKISQEQDGSAREKMIAEMKVLKDVLQRDEEKLRDVMQEWKELMLRVPNIPDMSVPEGAGEKDNTTIKEWGEKPDFSFEPKDHIELMTMHDMVDFERGTKAHGFRGYFLKNDGALLSWAIWNYARDFFLKRDFVPFIAPAIVRQEYFYGTGHLPNEAEDLYKTQDDDFLSGTAEVPMMAYHADEVLKKEELPKRYLAFSPCYRREAGSYGKDTKGLVRVHEFFKLEQLILCEGSHDESVKYFEEINRNYEEFIESLGIPYQQLLICTGDLSAGKVKQYDTEFWVPSQRAYREGSSASYYHDFQTRRFNIKYDDGGKKAYTHSLNSTAAATPRLLVSVVENYQQEDGTIKIPDVLQSYLGKEFIGT